MFRTVIACALLTSTQASRIQVREVSESRGASCEDLQSRFHDRVAGIQASLEGIDEQISVAQRTRIAFRMTGIMRTLRRARECQWVIENNSEDLVQMRGVVQQLLEANPCAEAARLELESGSSDENIQSVSRAMSILVSDDCEVPAPPQEGGNIDATPEELLQQAEDDLQDVLEGADSEESAFIEVDNSGMLRDFIKNVGVFFLMLFLILACTATMAAIALFLTAAVLFIGRMVVGPHFGLTAGMRRDRTGISSLIYLFAPILIGGVIGLPTCAYQLYNNLLPRLE